MKRIDVIAFIISLVALGLALFNLIACTTPPTTWDNSADAADTLPTSLTPPVRTAHPTPVIVPGRGQNVRAWPK